MSLLQRYLAQCIAWCEVNQKEHAWKLANNAAQGNPEELAELPALLTEMMRRKSQGQLIENVEKNEHLPSKS